MILAEPPPTAGLPPRLRDLLAALTGPCDLEERIAELIGVPEIRLECSGSASLVIAFEYLKTRSRRRTAIVSGYTCPLVVLAAKQAGLNVAVCDTVPGGFDLDLACLGRLATEDALCVIPTHYGGALTDVGRVRRFIEATSNETFVIEDAAQSFGAKYNGGSVGTIGHIGVFSFAVGKGFTLYEGGALYGETPEIRHGLRETSDRLRRRRPLLELRRGLELISYHFLYNPVGINIAHGIPRRYWLRRNDLIRATGDFFSGPIPIHAVSYWRRRVGCRSLSRLNAHLDHCSSTFKNMSEVLRRAAPHIDTHTPAVGFQPTGTFLFMTFSSEEDCNRVLQTLWPLGLGVTKLYACAIDEYPYLSSKLVSSARNASDLARRTLAVTTSEMLNEQHLAAIRCALQR